MNKNILDDLARFGCRAAIFLASISPALGSVSDDLRFEESDFMKATSYRRPDKLATANLAADGALSPVNIAWDRTHLGKWFIEEQRYGADAVAGGIAKNDTSAIDRGLLILHWGFSPATARRLFRLPGRFPLYLLFCGGRRSLSSSVKREPLCRAIRWRNKLDLPSPTQSRSVDDSPGRPSRG